ncbi:MAG: DUF4974 domain-containing protein [Odoribacteraceae bacterium]|jgi:ferric-dicitrate binding protein FerR (iron transport regulator)|nr:DUF4974 domain-containing protein [Odoribacteraceae bacterium]
MANENDTISRILDYLSGEQDEREREDTRAWIYADEQRRATFEKLRKKNMLLRWGTRVSLIRGTYADIRRRLTRRVLARRGRAAAAVLLLLSATGGAIYRHIASAPVLPVPVEEANQIFPGKPRAVIYLASGQGIAVSDTVQAILDPGVAEISVKEGGEMTYAPAPAPSPGAMHRVIIPRGGEFFIELSDGTRVWLNSRTELRYPVQFSPSRREIHLDGEAYFEVAAGASPFAVRAGEIEIVALGTAFNVSARGDGVTRAVLVTGSVEVTSENERVTLAPDQMAEFRESDGTLEVTDVDVMPHVAWKDDNFIFNRQYLGEIMRTLSLWYDVDVVYENEEVKQTRLTGDLKRYEDIRKLLYLFEQTSDSVSFDIKGKTITIQQEKRQRR